MKGSVMVRHLFQGYHIHKYILGCVYFALLLDNLLLTAVVPILPHFVGGDGEQNQPETATNSSSRNSNVLHFFKSSAEHFRRGFHHDGGENHRLGILLSLKAVVQLAANPIVAVVSQKRGLTFPMIFGTANLITCCILFAVGTSYEVLATARALQGITSACFTIAGLGLVASLHREENSRSSALGKALGGGAVGVLLGYPIGGLLYQFTGKMVPFLLIMTLGLVLLALLSTAVCLGTASSSEDLPFFPAENLDDEELYVADRPVVLGVAVGAIFLSTSVMALLEPCLPLWLLETMKPERWQLGAVFIPDSCGYLITTHSLGGIAYRFGRWKVAILSILVIGICCSLVPLAPSIIYLTVPHFGIGAGIGSVDAALVPLLATLAENNGKEGEPTTYGKTFALGQTAVSLAYCLGPLLGGLLVEKIGFPQLMLAMGIANLVYAPLILCLMPQEASKYSFWKKYFISRSGFANQYTRFKNSEVGEVNLN